MVSIAIRTQPPTKRHKMTADEIRAVYLMWYNLPETNIPTEIINGEIVMTPGAPPHGAAHIRLGKILANYVLDNDLGELYNAPTTVFIREDFVTEPDISFVRKDRLEIVRNMIFGPPDLVVEILSPSNARYDRTAKFTEYGKFGIPEYWIADPEKKTLEVYVNEGRKYILLGQYFGNQIVVSQVLPGMHFEASRAFLA